MHVCVCATLELSEGWSQYQPTVNKLRTAGGEQFAHSMLAELLYSLRFAKKLKEKLEAARVVTAQSDVAVRVLCGSE